MNWTQAIKRFIAAKRGWGDFNSTQTERSYRDTLEWLAEDSRPRGPQQVDRSDVRRTLERWDNPNTRRTRRAYMVSFFDWMVEEGLREANPARGTRRARRRPPQVMRWTLEEARAFLAAAQTPRERRIAYLGVCQGLRLGELLALRGRDFARPGWVHVHGKGKRDRWLPIVADAAWVAEEIRAQVGPNEYVLPAERWRVVHIEKRALPLHPASRGAVRGAMADICARAGLGHASPHVMRRAFADFIQDARGDIKLTQALLGHANPSTTDAYLAGYSPEGLQQAMRGLSFGGSIASGSGTTFEGVPQTAEEPLEAPTGIEPVSPASSLAEQDFRARWFAAAALEACEALAA